MVSAVTGLAGFGRVDPRHGNLARLDEVLGLRPASDQAPSHHFLVEAKPARSRQASDPSSSASRAPASSSASSRGQIGRGRGIKAGKFLQLATQEFEVGRSIHGAIIAAETEGPASCCRFVT